MFDLLIKDAEIHDGAGSAPVHGDLGVTAGKITAIGGKLGAARETVEARGLALAPGIIDGHTHYDAQITWDPFVDPSPALGVTTAVMGNCGFTIAPCRPADRDLTMRHLTHVEGMSLDALRAGIRWGFESFPQYLDMLEKQGVGPNVACFAGHSAIRTFVMGAEATERVATDDEIAAMTAQVREAMAAGAIGFATSTAEAHNGEGGTPMPSRLADDRELRTLVKAMGDSGRGVYMLTKGSKTSIAYLEELAVEAKRPVVIAAVFHSNTNPTAAFKTLEQINAARSRGHQLVAQTSCCPLSMDFTFKSPYLFESMQAWKPAMTSLRLTIAVTGTGGGSAMLPSRLALSCEPNTMPASQPAPFARRCIPNGLPSVTTWRTRVGVSFASSRAKPPPRLQPTRLTARPCRAWSASSRSSSRPPTPSSSPRFWPSPQRWVR